MAAQIDAGETKLLLQNSIHRLTEGVINSNTLTPKQAWAEARRTVKWAQRWYEVTTLTYKRNVNARVKAIVAGLDVAEPFLEHDVEPTDENSPNAHEYSVENARDDQRLHDMVRSVVAPYSGT